MVLAQQIGGPQCAAIADLARTSFASAHHLVLVISALLIGALSVLVFFGLRGFHTSSEEAKTENQAPEQDFT